MDKCPKCHQLTFVFDPHTSSGKCLRLQCSYSETVDRIGYTVKFQKEKISNAAIQTSFLFDNKTG